MQNPFDINANAAAAGGSPRPQAGMRTASNLIAEAQARLDTQKTAAAPPQPSVFGFNKSTNQFFSAGKTWSADNLSEVDSYDKAGYFDVDNRGKMPDGFTPVTPDAIRGWKEKKAAERGFGSAAAETGRQVMQGVADIPNMAVQAAAMSAPAGSWLEGQLGDAAKEYERTSRTPDTYGRGETAQAFIGAGRSIPSSVAAGVASVAAPIVGTGAAGYVMGASQAWDTYQRGLAAGLSPEDAKAAAIKTGSIEGIGETAADAIGARVTMGAGKVVGSLLRGASIGHGKRVAVDLLANAGLQSGTEYGQSYGQAAVERDAGISSQDPHAAGYEGFKQGLAMSALMAPFGIAAGVANRPGPTPPAPAPAAAQPPMPPATPGAPQLGYETPLQLGFNGVHGLNDESPIPQGYNPLSTPITSAGQAWQGMSPSMTGDSEIIGLQGAPGAPVSAGQAGAAWQQMPQSQQTLEGGYQNLDEQRAGAMQMQSERDAEAARKEDLVEQRGAAIRGVGTMPVSPSEGSATAVAPSVSPQEPQTPAELFTPETLQSKTRSEIAIIAQNLGINPNDVSAARKGRATKTELIAAVMKAQAPAEPDRQTRSADNKWAQAQETLSTPKRGPKSKKPTAAPVPPAVSDDTAAILGELEAAVATQPARVRGKITMPKQVLSGIMRAIKAPFTAYGTPATPRAYGDGTATPDPETEGKYMAQMIAVRDAAHKVIELAKSHYDNVANRTPTASKALLKKRPGETRETAGNTQANEVGAQTAKDVRETQVRLSSALKEFADAAGGMPNANALIAVIKGRIQQISSKNVDKAKKETTVDTMLSRAWKEYVDGVLDTPENIATVRSGEIRNSQEQQKRGAESEPLEKAATEGYNSRPKGKESAEAYATRQKQNAGAIGVLNYITRHGTQFEAFLSSAIATALKAGKTTPKLKFIEGGSPHYDPKTDTIYVSKTASPEVVLHETLHAALQWYVHTHPSHAAVLKLKNALKTVLSYDRASLSPKAQEVFDVLAKLEKKNPLDAVLELISYGATLREFNVALTQIKSSDKTGFLGAVSDLWKRITSLVQNFLGVRDTVANDVLDSTIKLLEEAADAGGERAPRKGAKLNDEGTLYAAVQSSTPASNATPPGGTPNVDLTKFTKKMLPNIITEHVFKAMGWDAVPEKFADAAGTVADYIRDKSPALSKYIGYINPNFNVPVPAREWFQQYKNEKHVSGIVTDALANKIASLPKDQVLDLMEYLDGDKTALKDNAEARELADMLLDHRAEYIKGLRSKEAQAFFRDLKFTETMIFAKGTDDVASNALGSRKLNELAAQKSDTQLTDNIYTPLDAMGNPVFDGRFYQVVQPNTLSPSGDPMVAGFVHESMVGKLPAGTAVATDGLVWTHAGKSAKEKDAQRFTAYRDAKAAIEEGKANTAANALRNTMAILAANYASNNLTDSLASLSGDTTYMAVFNNVKDIEAATGMRPAQGSILKLSAAEAKSGRLQGIYRSKHQWVQVPNGVTYGELAGMLVRSDVWSAIQDMTDRRPLHNVSALHTTMRTFKKAKTVYNPATHVTNIASNVTLAMMHDIPMPTVAQATRLLFQYATNPNKMDAEERRVVHAFMNSGAMLGDFSMLEVKKDLYEAYKTATAENEPSGVYAKLTAWAGIEKAKAAKFAEYAKVGKDKLGTADDKITALYAAEDNAFRLAAFLSKSGEIATRKGKTYLTPQEFKEAGDYARFAFLDYDIDSKAVKIMRQSVLPFVSWSYAIMPVLGHIALHKPWKLVNVLLAYSLLDAAMGGDDDDEKRKEGPEKFRSRLWGVGPHAYIRVPFMGDEKNPVYFKLGAYMPTGNWMDKQPMGFLGINNWPQPISPGGPFTNVIIGLMGGIDPYTGKPLSAPTDSTWEEVADRAKFMGATFTPGWTPAAVDVATKAVGGRGKPEKGLAGNPVSNLEAARRFGGLQLETFNTDEATIQRNIAIRSEKAAFEKELAKLRRAEARYEKPDWEAFNKRRDELLARRDERIKDIKGEE